MTVGFHWRREDLSGSTSVQEIVDRVQAEWRAENRRIQAMQERPAQAGFWPSGWLHDAPERPLSVDEAHMTMQRHGGCRGDECPRKSAARQALIDAGRMKPDTSREPR